MAEGIVKTNGRILYVNNGGKTYYPGINVDIDDSNTINACSEFRVATYNETDGETLKEWNDKPILLAYNNLLYFPIDTFKWQVDIHSTTSENVRTKIVTWSEEDGWQESEGSALEIQAGYGLKRDRNVISKNDTFGYTINSQTCSYFDLGRYDLDAGYGQAAIRFTVTYAYGYEAVYYVRCIRAVNYAGGAIAYCIGANTKEACDYLKTFYVLRDDQSSYRGFRFIIQVKETSNVPIHVEVNYSGNIGKFKVGCSPLWSMTTPSDYYDKAQTVYNGGTGGGTTYSAGDAIGIVNDTISVNIGKGLEKTSDNKLQVKIGKGLKFDVGEGIEGEISLDNTSQDVIDMVTTLSKELDKKITTTFNYAQIVSAGDFAPFGVTGTTRMIGQLFATPITSEIRLEDTLICVRAQQTYDGNVSFGIFEFDFDGNEGTGSTTWLCDTGTVKVKAGENQFPVKHIIPTNTLRPTIKMEPGKLYYATVMIDGAAPASGLFLASCEAYDQNYNATPKYTLLVSNLNQHVDWSNGSQRNTWFQGYNEFNNIPRLFMMIRNGEATPIATVDPFNNIGTTYSMKDDSKISDFFSLSLNQQIYPVMYQKIIPEQECVITKVGWIDNHSTSTYESGNDIPLILDDTYTSITSVGDNTLSQNTQRSDGYYYHEYTLATPLALVAKTIYYVPADFNIVDINDKLISYANPSDITKDLLLFTSKWNVSTWAGDNVELEANIPGTSCTITTNDGKQYIF